MSALKIDREMDAAERALGTLPEAEDKDALTREEDRLLTEWEERLAPLAAMVQPVDPPPGLFDRVVEMIDTDETLDFQEALIARKERSRKRWRSLAALSSLAAAAAGVWIAIGNPVALLTPPAPAPQPVAETGRYLAVATADDGPALVVEFDLAAGIATVRPVGVAAPAAGRSLELWHIEDGQAPRSLGLMRADAPVDAAFRAAPGDVIAVTLEPEGGAPGGNPTGPVILSGPVIRAE